MKKILIIFLKVIVQIIIDCEIDVNFLFGRFENESHKRNNLDL